MKLVIYALGANIISKGGLLTINLISAKILSVSEYGLMAYILTLIGVVSSFVVVGSGVAVNVVVAKNFDKKKEDVNSFITFSIMLSLLIAPLACYLVIILNPNMGRSFDYLYPMMMILTVFYSYNSINDSVFIGSKNFKFLFITSSITFCISIPAAVFLIYYYGFLGALFSLMIYRAIYSLSHNFFINKKNLYQLDFGKNILNNFNLFHFKKLSLPSFVSGIVIMPSLALGFGFLSKLENGFEKLGYFLIVYQVYLVAVFVPNALNGFYISKFSSSGKKSDVIGIAKINLLFSSIVCILFYFGQDLLWKYLGEDYYINSKSSYNIMLLVIILYSLSTVFSSFWPSINKAWIGSLMNILWSLIFILSCYLFLLVYELEQIGMAFAFLSSYSVLLFVQITIYYIFKNMAKI